MLLIEFLSQEAWLIMGFAETITSYLLLGVKYFVGNTFNVTLFMMNGMVDLPAGQVNFVEVKNLLKQMKIKELN